MAESQNYINHIVLVLDHSTSMGNLAQTVVKVADMQVAELAQSSQALDQETRMTVYQFGNTTECIYFDKDVLRMPSIKNKYRIEGSTALIDATMQAINDLKQTNTLYGDHAFLVYVLTDGQENTSKRFTASTLRAELSSLPDNWTVACLVPDSSGIFYAKNVGFSANNIAIWDTTAKGLEEVGQRVREITNNYMTARSQGLRGTKDIFTLDLSSVSTAVTKGALTAENVRNYTTLHVDNAIHEIKPFVMSYNLPYKIGSVFYQLTKNEHIQSSKKIAIRERNSQTVYTGDAARKMLNLPDHEVKVQAINHPDFDIFVQSKSVNRKLMPNTDVLVFK